MENNTLEKASFFEKEISYIKNAGYVESFKTLISGLPDYFFEIEASTTGKYHPKYALGVGGLLRHTKAAVRIAVELLSDPSIGDKYTSNEKDLMIIALTLHDGFKCGNPKQKYTQANHPLLIADYLRQMKEQVSLSEEEIEFLASGVASHMGPWNTDPYTKEEILPKPHTKYQNFIHMCDYLASRKILNVEFDAHNEIID